MKLAGQKSNSVKGVSTMKALLNLGTGKKLALLGGSGLLSTVLVGIIAFSGLTKSSDSIRKINENSFALVQIADDIHASILKYRILHYQATASKDEARQTILKKIADQENSITKAYEEGIKFAATQSDKELFKKSEDCWNAYIETDAKWKNLVAEGNIPAAREYMLTTLAQIGKEKIDPSIDELTSTQDKAAKQAAKSAIAATNTNALQMLTLCVIAIAAVASLSVIIGRHISGLVKVLGARMSQISDVYARDLKNGLVAFSNYDLTVQVDSSVEDIQIHSTDDLGKMATTFNQMKATIAEAVTAYTVARENLTGIVYELIESSKSVNETSQQLRSATNESGSASNEIAEGSSRLAQSASNVASTVEVLVGSVRDVRDAAQYQTELAASVMQDLDSASTVAEKARQSSMSSAQAVHEGQTSVKEITDGNLRVESHIRQSSDYVQKLDEAGRQIGTIVDAISAIAEQTNLLALNATIEAARAGEHGRGFAVVAEEVRKLAEQSGEQTKRIGELISTIQSSVEATVGSINEIVPLVEQSTVLGRKADDALLKISSETETMLEQAEKVATLNKQAFQAVEQVSIAARSTSESAVAMSHGADNVAASVQTVAATSQEAAASAEEPSATNQEVAASADELNHMADQLEQIAEKFTVTNQNEKRSSLRLAA